MAESTWLHEDEIEIDLGKILKSLCKNLWWLGLVSFLCGLIGWGLSCLRSPEYVSGAIFYVKNNTSNAGSISSADIAASKELVDSYLVILESGDTLEAVIHYAGSHRSRTEIREMISASAVNSTEFFRVEITAPTPEEAEQLSDAIAHVLPQRIGEILAGSSAKIVDTAVAEPEAARRQHMKTAGIGLGAGLILSTLVIMLGTMLDKTICTERDIVKHTGLPVLATVSQKDSCTSESTKLLRAKLRYLCLEQERACVVGITDVTEGSGAALTAGNLAAGLAQLEERVVLLLWDPRKNAPYNRYIDRNHPGLGDYLQKNAELEDILQQCSIDGGKIRIPVITTGTSRGNPAELLGSKRLPMLLSELRELYDYILLDLPPAEKHSGILEAARNADGILLQTAENRCDRDTLKGLLEQLSFVDTPVLGVVFCKAPGKKRKRKKHRYEK